MERCGEALAGAFSTSKVGRRFNGHGSYWQLIGPNSDINGVLIGSTCSRCLCSVPGCALSQLVFLALADHSVLHGSQLFVARVFSSLFFSVVVLL